MISQFMGTRFFLIYANPFHRKKRCANTERCYRELEISTERRVRRRKNVSGINSDDVVISL